MVRREGLTLFLEQMKEEMITAVKGNIALVWKEELLAHEGYAGLLAGLSVIQGGPHATFLYDILKNSEGEIKTQFLSGLERTGLLQLMNKTSTMKYLFRQRAPDTEDTGIKVNPFLRCFTVTFSGEGTNRKIEEEAAYNKFIRYLREVYAGRRGDVKMDKILKFATGSSTMPLLGFGMTPSIDFADVIFPTASTCINRIYLPLDIDFERMDMAFMQEFFGLE